jgi:DNA-directed RNA polymerase specialized sigma24 family protein
MTTSRQLLVKPGRERRRPGALHEVLYALPKKYRRVLEPWCGAGHSIKEASPVMAVSVSNTKVTQLRAVRTAAGPAQEAGR